MKTSRLTIPIVEYIPAICFTALQQRFPVGQLSGKEGEQEKNHSNDSGVEISGVSTAPHSQVLLAKQDWSNFPRSPLKHPTPDCHI